MPSLEILLAGVGVCALLWALGKQAGGARLQQGRFDVKRDDAGVYRFETDTGTFEIDRVGKTFRSSLATSLPLDGLERLDFDYSEEKARRLLWRRDTGWYHITLVAGPRRISLFSVGQKLRPKPIDSNAELAASWFPDVDRRAQEVHTQLWKAFRESGSRLVTSGGARVR